MWLWKSDSDHRADCFQELEIIDGPELEPIQNRKCIVYKIIGADQKEYGPVATEQLCQWIGDGRANGSTRARLEGTTEWNTLSSFPDFATALATKTGASSPPLVASAAEPANALDLTEQILARPLELRIGRCLSRSWRLLKNNFGLLVGATLLNGLAQTVANVIPFGGLIVNGALMGGLYLLFLKRIRGQSATVGDAFSGFSLCFVQLLLTALVAGVLQAFGFLFCFLPGVYLFVAWFFSLALVADQRLEFWDAMELSRRVANRVWFQLFGLLIVSLLPTLICMLIFVGTLIAAFSAVIASGNVDFAKLMGVFAVTGALSLLTTVVSLINLPFAAGALMYAYEDLFGARSAPAA